MKFFVKAVLVTVLCLSLIPVAAQATIATFDMDHEFSGAFPPVGVAPWITATFDDKDTPGSVKLTMSDTHLTDSEFVAEWYFNLDPNFNPVNLAFDYVSGVEAFSVEQGVDLYKADGDGLYDILFTFPKKEFSVGDSSIYNITGIGDLEAGSFLFESTPAGGNGPFHSAAHVQGIGEDGENSGWIANTTTHTPEPSTILMLITGLGGIVTYGSRRKRKV